MTSLLVPSTTLAAGAASHPHWADDATSMSCSLCTKRFTTFSRRHHCRLCGQCYCSACSTARIPIPWQQAQQAQQQQQQPSSSSPSLPSSSSSSFSVLRAGGRDGAGEADGVEEVHRACNTCASAVAALDGLSTSSSTQQKTRSAMLLASLAPTPHFAYVISKLGAVSLAVRVLLTSSDEHCVTHGALALARLAYSHSNSVLISAMGSSVFGPIAATLPTASDPSASALCVAACHLVLDDEMKDVAAAAGLVATVLNVLARKPPPSVASVGMALLAQLLTRPAARAVVYAPSTHPDTGLPTTGVRTLLHSLHQGPGMSLEQSFKLLARGSSVILACARDASTQALASLVSAGAVDALIRGIHLAIELLASVLGRTPRGARARAAGPSPSPSAGGQYVAALRVMTQGLALLARVPATLDALALAAEPSGESPFSSMASPAAMGWSFADTLAVLVGFPGGMVHTGMVLNDDDRHKLTSVAARVVAAPFVMVQVLGLLGLVASHGGAELALAFLPFTVRLLGSVHPELGAPLHPSVTASATLALAAMIEHCESNALDADDEPLSVAMSAVYAGVADPLVSLLDMRGGGPNPKPRAEDGSSAGVQTYALALVCSLAVDNEACASLVRNAELMACLTERALCTQPRSPQFHLVARAVALMAGSVPAALRFAHDRVCDPLVSVLLDTTETAAVVTRVTAGITLASLMHSVGTEHPGLEDAVHALQMVTGEWRDAAGSPAHPQAFDGAATADDTYLVLLEVTLRMLSHASEREIVVFALEVVALSLRNIPPDLATPRHVHGILRLVFSAVRSVSRHVLHAAARVLCLLALGFPSLAPPIITDDKRTAKIQASLEASHYADLRELAAHLGAALAVDSVH